MYVCIFMCVYVCVRTHVWLSVFVQTRFHIKQTIRLDMP